MAGEESGSLNGLLEGIRGVCDAATDLSQLCDSFLEFLTTRLGCRRALFLVLHEEEVEGAAVGVPDPFLQKLVGAARKEGEGILPVAEPGEDGPSWPPALLTSFPEARDFQVFPFRLRGEPLSGALFLDMDGKDPALDDLLPLLQRVAPALARVAELEALREERDRHLGELSHLRTVFDSLPDPVVVLDGENRLILSNRRAEELLVSDSGDSPGRRRAVETNNLFFSAFRAKAVLGDEEESRELLLVDPVYGSDLLFEVTPTAVPTELGSTDVSIHILRDITDLKRATTELEQHYKRSVAAEHQARQESERLNVILANIGVPILVTDEWSDIVLVNHRGARLFEAPSDARESSPRVGRVRANGAKITGLISDFLLQPQPRREEELGLVDPDGIRDLPVRALLTKILNRRGEPTAVVCVIDDLSEEREIQRLAEELQELNRELEKRVEAATGELTERNRELERQREELARASRLKSEFLAMMSHELRTPINSILGYNSLLREGVLGEMEERQHQALERVEASSGYLLSLINDLLDLSKVEAGQISLSPSATQVGPLLGNLAETIRPLAEKKELDFDLEVPEDLPAVWADPTRLRQVLLNLTTNALKFTAEGGVTVRAFALTDAKRVRFEVEDTGPGIRQEDQERIFEEFYQADRFETREHGGTGLGLSISRKLLALMDASLSVRSEPGKGAVFSADLPVADSRMEAPVGTEAAPEPGTEEGR